MRRNIVLAIVLTLASPGCIWVAVTQDVLDLKKGAALTQARLDSLVARADSLEARLDSLSVPR